MAVQKMLQQKQPKLRNLDALFGLEHENNNAAVKQPQDKDTTYEIVPFELMDDYPGHRFHLYEGERKSDMVYSIQTKGILQDIILRPTSDGRYHILSGHNRKYCAMESGLACASCKIKHNLTDEEAWIYVVETNLIQRGFNEMTDSEKAAVIALHHSKLFSQGKRNDILNELKILENPHNNRAEGTSPQVGEKLHADKKIGKMYSLSKNTVARYLRINELIVPLKGMLDNNKVAFMPAVTLSFLKELEQKALAHCAELNGFRIDQKKADTLRQYSESGKLDEDNIYLILNGEVGKKTSVNRTPTIKVSKSVYNKYFTPQQSSKEVQSIVEQALQLYFSQK